MLPVPQGLFAFGGNLNALNKMLGRKASSGSGSFLGEVSSPRCHGRQWPRGGSVGSEMQATGLQAIPGKASLGSSGPAKLLDAD